METITEISDNPKNAVPLLRLVLSKLLRLQKEFIIMNETAQKTESELYQISRSIVGVNDTEKSSLETLSTLPQDFTQISQLNKRCVIVYTILFFFAAVGNLFVLYSVFPRKNLKKTRITLLITNLCVADLIVTFFLMPTEIFWRITIGWNGGELLCKLSQFVRAFGLYLSSNVVICISIDRYYSIVHPLKLGGAVWRVKLTLVGAWIVSTAFAGPQIFVYHVAQHPTYPEFRQCVTKAFLTEEPYNELIYNVSSVSALYFIPLLVVIYTYTMILWKLYRKSKEHRVANNYQGASSKHEPFLPSNSRLLYRKLSSSSSETDSKKTRVILRCSDKQRITMSRARSRTLKLTLLILLTFIVCWTPYVTITLWYMLDRTGASQVDERLQEALFIMTVANSVINPFIYGTVGRKQQRKKNYRVPFISISGAKSNPPCAHFKSVYLLRRKRNVYFIVQGHVNGIDKTGAQVYEHTSNGVRVGKKKSTNFDSVLGFNPGIKRGRLGRRNNDFILSDRITI